MNSLSDFFSSPVRHSAPGAGETTPCPPSRQGSNDAHRFRSGREFAITGTAEDGRRTSTPAHSQCPLGRQSTLDEMRRCASLVDALLAHPARVLRTHGDDDPKLCRNDVEPLGAVLADAYHLPAPARAARTGGLDDLLEPGQMFGKVAQVALGARRVGAAAPRFLPGRLFEFGHRAFECLEGELELVRMQLLGLLPVHQPAQLSHQVFQAPMRSANEASSARSSSTTEAPSWRSRWRLRSASAALSARSVSSADCCASNSARTGGAANSDGLCRNTTAYRDTITRSVCYKERRGPDSPLRITPR